MADFSKNLSWQMSHPEIELSYNLDYDPATVWLIPALNEYARELPFYVQEVGRTIAGEQYYVGRKNLDSFIIGCIQDGGITLNYNGIDHDLHTDSVIWLDCRHPHTFRISASCDHVDCYFVHFWGDGARKYHEFFESIAPSGCVQMDSTERFMRYLKRLISLYSADNRNAMTELSACTYLANLCLELLDNVQEKTVEAPPAYILQVKQILESSYAEKITLDMLAQKLFVSQSYLQKQFKHHYGCSPNDYLLQIRLSQAKVLLRNTSKSINDIAYEVGFNTPSYFISIFSKKEGVTPLAYRKMWASL